MLKKSLKMLYLIPAYIILVIFQNFKIIYLNNKAEINFYTNIDYMNKSILISLLFMLIIILFYRKIKNYKLTIISALFVIFSCSLLNGVFVGRNLDNFIFIYLYLLFLTYFATYIFKQRFEISIFIATSIILVSMYILALFNLLIVVKYLITLSVLVGLIYILFNFRKNQKQEKIIKAFNNFNRSGILIFSIFFILFILGGINRYVSIWDEYSHWAFDAKAVINFNKLSTCSEVVSRTRNYPPILSLWHYFINIFMRGFNEENLYIGLFEFELIFLMPALSIINKKNSILSPFISIALIFSCYLLGGVYSYSSLYADLALALVFANCFVIYILTKNNIKVFRKLLGLNLIILILIKPNGFVLATVFLLILMIDDYIKLMDTHSLNFINKVKKIFKNYWKLIVLVIGTTLIWFVYIKIMNIAVKDYYDFILKAGGLSTSISDKLDIVFIFIAFKNLLKAFNETVINLIIPLNLYQYIIFIFTALILAFYYGNNKSLKVAFKKMFPIFIGYVAFFMLTLLSILVTFSKYEAQNLASFARYLDSFHLALIIFLITYTFSDEFYLSYNNKIKSIILLCVFLITIPYKNVMFVLYDHKDKITEEKFSISMNQKFEIVKNNTNENDLVYVLDQKDKDGIMAMWYARYYLFPRKTNASGQAINWKILTDINGDDLGGWGLTATTLAKSLYDYNFNYLYLYSYDDYMYDEMRYLFTDYSKAKNSTLFRVIKEKRSVKLVPVI